MFTGYPLCGGVKSAILILEDTSAYLPKNWTDTPFFSGKDWYFDEKNGTRGAGTSAEKTAKSTGLFLYLQKADARVSDLGAAHRADSIGAGLHHRAGTKQRHDGVSVGRCAADRRYGTFHAGIGDVHDPLGTGGGQRDHSLQEGLDHRGHQLPHRYYHHRGGAGSAGAGQSGACHPESRHHLVSGCGRRRLFGHRAAAYPAGHPTAVAADRVLCTGVRPCHVRLTGLLGGGL